MIKKVRSILHLNDKAGQFGGTEEYIASITRLFSSIDVASYLVFGKQYGLISPDFISYFKVPGLASRDMSNETPNQVLSIIDKVKPDIVYLHNIFDGHIVHSLDIPNRSYMLLWYIHDHYPTCLTELQVRKSKPKIICHKSLSKNCLLEINYNNCIKRYKNRNYDEQDLLSRRFLLESTKKVDAIIVVSEYMKEILIRNLPELDRKVQVLPRQVRGCFNPKKKSQSDLNVIFIGRIVREKGLHLILIALLHIKFQQPIILKIAGAIEDYNYWLCCIQLAYEVQHQKPNIKIHYLGLLSYENVDLLYDEADIAIVPSIWGEPSGTVAAEALKHCVAVIAFDVGGISTWIQNEKTGILVEPGNVLALSKAIEHLIYDEDYRRKLTITGYSLIMEEFTDKKHLSALFEVIKNRI
jgi:glycosyltransferase involved in cell wall biosynthesis